MTAVPDGHKAKQDDVATLAGLAKQWVEIGWHHSKDEPFDFRTRLERFYEWTSDGTHFFDDFDPKRRVNATVAQYAAIWDERIPTMQRLFNVMVGEPSTLVSDDLAVMSVRFVTSYVTAEGEVGEAITMSSLVWRKSADGWRIIREHGSGLKPHG